MKGSLHACHCSEESENREVIIGCDKEVCASVKDEKDEMHKTFVQVLATTIVESKSNVAGMENESFQLFVY